VCVCWDDGDHDDYDDDLIPPHSGTSLMPDYQLDQLVTGSQHHQVMSGDGRQNMLRNNDGGGDEPMVGSYEELVRRYVVRDVHSYI